MAHVPAIAVAIRVYEYSKYAPIHLVVEESLMLPRRKASPPREGSSSAPAPFPPFPPFPSPSMPPVPPPATGADAFDRDESHLQYRKKGERVRNIPTMSVLEHGEWKSSWTSPPSHHCHGAARASRDQLHSIMQSCNHSQSFVHSASHSII